QKKGGIITHDDLKNYKAIWREPLVFEYQDAKIITMGPPSSGGVALAQMLGMYSQIPKQKSVPNDAQYIQRLTEVMRRAYADRNEYLGDPDFVKIPLRELTSEAYLRRRMHSYRPQTATKTSRITPGKIT
ncbi:gamma-glutamyltransferase, partial [Arthrospira platensis SPKY2]